MAVLQANRDETLHARVQVAFGVFGAADFESDDATAAATARALRLHALNRVAFALIAVDGVDMARLCAFQERLHNASLDEELSDPPTTAAAGDSRAAGKQFVVVPTGPSPSDILAATTALLRGIDPVRAGRVAAHIASTSEAAHASADALVSLLSACPGVGDGGSGACPTPQQLEMLVDRVSSLAGLALDMQTPAGIDAVAACLPPHAATALCSSMGCLPNGVIAHE